MATQETLKLDIGCGKVKKEGGYVGVDCLAFEGVDVVCNVGRDTWPWADNSVDEINCSHMLEHLWPWERIHFANEAFRVLKPGAKMTIITPHESGARAFGDLSHKWPAVSESWFFHLNRKWREENSPHMNEEQEFHGAPGGKLPPYTCDYVQPPTWGYSTNPSIVGRSQEWWMFATNHYRETISDLIATVQKPEEPKK